MKYHPTLSNSLKNDAISTHMNWRSPNLLRPLSMAVLMFMIVLPAYSQQKVPPNGICSGGELDIEKIQFKDRVLSVWADGADSKSHLDLITSTDSLGIYSSRNKDEMQNFPAAFLKVNKLAQTAEVTHGVFNLFFGPQCIVSSAAIECADGPNKIVIKENEITVSGFRSEDASEVRRYVHTLKMEDLLKLDGETMINGFRLEGASGGLVPTVSLIFQPSAYLPMAAANEGYLSTYGACEFEDSAK